MIKIDVLRHGECQGGEIFRGATDVALTQQGWSQMRAAAMPHHGVWDAVVTSPMLRCHAFATELAEKLDLPLRVDDGWREMSFGDWEGQIRDELFAREGERIAAFYRDPVGCPPPNGEAADVLQTRVVQAYQRVLQESGGRRVLVVSHGGVIRALLAHVLGMPLDRLFTLDVPYACLSGLHHVERGGFSRLLYHSAPMA